MDTVKIALAGTILKKHSALTKSQIDEAVHEAHFTLAGSAVCIEVNLPSPTGKRRYRMTFKEVQR